VQTVRVTAKRGSGGKRHGKTRRPARRSAGILLYRQTAAGTEVLLGHMGGPFWERRDTGAWSIPKGLTEPGEDLLAAAHREFREELGVPVPPGELIDLGSVKQSANKIVTVWALEGDLDPAQVVPGTFTMEWPPRSGRIQEFPEIDRAAWFDLDTAYQKIVAYQRPFLDRLRDHLRRAAESSS
jgi:predicted NUDIX family NTP pyrophosphohydrolase